MTAQERYESWRAQPGLAQDVAEELAAIASDAEAIEDRFYRDLAFGTGGLRGVLGAGTNRMNVYTVAKATRGLAAYLLAQFPAPACAIAYDSRRKSALFAQTAAAVLAAAGVRVHLYAELMPTPMQMCIRDRGSTVAHGHKKSIRIFAEQLPVSGVVPQYNRLAHGPVDIRFAGDGAAGFADASAEMAGQAQIGAGDGPGQVRLIQPGDELRVCVIGRAHAEGLFKRPHQHKMHPGKMFQTPCGVQDHLHTLQGQGAAEVEHHKTPVRPTGGQRAVDL